MKKFKKFLIVITTFILLTSTVLFVSCKTTTVIEDKPTVTLNYDKLKMEIGSSIDLVATLNGFDKEQSVEWFTYGDTIASVSEKGKVTALGNGTTSIIAQVGDYSASCEVIVLEAVVEKNDVNVSLSQKIAVLNAQSSSNTVNLSAVVTVNGVVVNSDVVWSSSNEQAVTVSDGLVTALENGKEVFISASTVYNGNKITAVCKIITDGFSAIIPSDSVINLYPGETHQIDFDLYVSGELNEQEKANVTFSADSQGVISLTNDGLITAKNSGYTTITLKYGQKTVSVSVNVGKVHYVDNAERFMQIEGAQKLNRYILTDNIDLSGYFAKTPAINGECLINTFDGELIGNGYTVSGYQRLKTSQDNGFYGIFKNIEENAVIDGVGFKFDVEIKDTASLIAANNYGTIKNSLFDIASVSPFTKAGSALFEISNGKVENSVFVINYNEQSENGILKVANAGYGTYYGVSVVNQDVVGGEGYTSVQNVAQLTESIDKTVFEIDGSVYLKNEKNKRPVDYPTISVADYQTAEVGSALELNTPTATAGASLSVKVFELSGNEITAQTCEENSFTPPYAGVFYAVHLAQVDGAFVMAVKEVKAVNNLPAINKNTVVLKLNETFTLSVEGKAAEDFNYFSLDQKIATVSDLGVITAVKEGSTAIRLVDKQTGISYKVVITVTENYTEISDAAGLKALGSAQKGEYFVLTNDISLTQEDVTILDAEGVKLGVVIDAFSGVLDGQGHKISLQMNLTGENTAGLGGLIRTINREAIIRNLHYEADITYAPYSSLAFASAFVRTLSGTLENSYIKATLRPTSSPSDNIGLIGYFHGQDGLANSTFMYNNVFEMTTIYDGEILDYGNAVRVGVTPRGYAYDCVFIRNGITATFFGDFNNGASAVECTNASFYKTLYDFVNAKNGYDYSTRRNATKLNDGEQVYLSWPSEWTIDYDAIYLCGRKVADVKHEAYVESRAINISERQGVLSWISDETDFTIAINGKEIAKTNAKSFDLYSYIVQNYGTADADYNVLIKASEASGVAVFSIVGLTKDNFLTELKAAKEKELAEFKYYVLQEDISIPFSNATSDGFMINRSYANVDGRGYVLSVTANSTDVPFRGLIAWNYGLWTNTTVVISARYKLSGSSRSFMFGTCYDGGIYNCAILIKATPVDNNGNVVIDNKACVVVEPHVKAKYENCLFILNAEGDTVICPFGGGGSGGAYLRNCAVVRDTISAEMAISYEADKGVSNSARYRSLQDFVAGSGTKYTKNVNSTTITTEEVKLKPIYTSWGSVWQIKNGKITLCGKMVAEIYEGGDVVINDGAIPEV